MKKYPSMQGSLWWISFYLFAGCGWGTAKICLNRSSFYWKLVMPKGLLRRRLAGFQCFSVKSLHCELQWDHVSGVLWHSCHVHVPWVRKIPCRRARQPTAVLSPGESHGWRNLVGCTVHRVAKSQTGLKRLRMHTCIPCVKFTEDKGL